MANIFAVFTGFMREECFVRASLLSRRLWAIEMG
jgi:hypothetical protein